jgi:hypothetical protein
VFSAYEGVGGGGLLCVRKFCVGVYRAGWRSIFMCYSWLVPPGLSELWDRTLDAKSMHNVGHKV